MPVGCQASMGGNVCGREGGHNDPMPADYTGPSYRHRHEDPLFGEWWLVPEDCSCGGCIHSNLIASGARMAGG